MRILLSALLACLGLAAGAAEARQFAVLSLMGDKLLVVQYYPNEGFRSDNSLEASVQLDDNSLDKTALQAADATLQKIEPGAKPVLLVAKDTALYEAQAALARSGKDSRELLPSLGPMLRGSGATHLILVTKLKHEARVQQFKDTLLGSGQLEGLGFYVDTGRPLPNAPQGAPTPAVLGPFAYFRLELIDIATGRILREEKVVASRTFTNPETGNAWTALSNREKILVLQDIIRRETTNAIPNLVKLAR
jgi:hypothetical protein